MKSLTQPNSPADPSRRGLLKIGAFAGISLLGGGLLAGCGGNGDDNTLDTSQDASILGAAKIAEALATTMYTAIIEDAPFFGSIDDDDKQYIFAAREEEKFHYDLLKSSTDGMDAPLKYYFPAGMFTDVQTTLNVLVTLEEAFIAAYLIGVQDLSSSSLKVLAAQILGVESEHRTLARVIASGLGLPTVTGLSGSPENVEPPNNVVYERRFGLTSIDQVVTALTPFITPDEARVEKTFDPTYVPVNNGLYPNPANP